MKTNTYHVEHRQGFGALGHFGAEIVRRLASEFNSLAEARQALRQAKAGHGSPQRERFDIVSSDGKRWSWE